MKNLPHSNGSHPFPLRFREISPDLAFLLCWHFSTYRAASDFVFPLEPLDGFSMTLPFFSARIFQVGFWSVLKGTERVGDI